MVVIKDKTVVKSTWWSESEYYRLLCSVLTSIHGSLFKLDFLDGILWLAGTWSWFRSECPLRICTKIWLGGCILQILLLCYCNDYHCSWYGSTLHQPLIITKTPWAWKGEQWKNRRKCFFPEVRATKIERGTGLHALNHSRNNNTASIREWSDWICLAKDVIAL